MILLLLLACPVDVSADMEAHAPNAQEAAANEQAAGTVAPGGDPQGEPFVPPPTGGEPVGPPLGPHRPPPPR